MGDSRFKVAIWYVILYRGMLLALTNRSGGGIGGLTTALAITHFSKGRNDIKVDIYEAAARFTEIGAGFVLSLRPWRVMRTLGLDKDLEALLDFPVQNFPPSKLGDLSLNH